MSNIYTWTPSHDADDVIIVDDPRGRGPWGRRPRGRGPWRGGPWHKGPWGKGPWGKGPWDKGYPWPPPYPYQPPYWSPVPGGGYAKQYPPGQVGIPYAKYPGYGLVK